MADATARIDLPIEKSIVLKYRTMAEAAKKLGGVAAISDAFVGFQRHLYVA
jgi:hypothetical protein